MSWLNEAIAVDGVGKQSNAKRHVLLITEARYKNRAAQVLNLWTRHYEIKHGSYIPEVVILKFVLVWHLQNLAKGFWGKYFVPKKIRQPNTMLNIYAVCYTALNNLLLQWTIPVSYLKLLQTHCMRTTLHKYHILLTLHLPLQNTREEEPQSSDWYVEGRQQSTFNLYQGETITGKKIKSTPSINQQCAAKWHNKWKGIRGPCHLLPDPILRLASTNLYSYTQI